VTALERLVRARVTQVLRDTSAAPSVADLASALEVSEARVREALAALADAHLLVLGPGRDVVRMAAPFSAVPTDFQVRIGAQSWYANCAWDGLAILAFLGDGTLETHSPATGERLQFVVSDGQVTGEGIVHFLVPARGFWDDIGFT
jgi:DNA-binding transcriptional MocR family regulator